jgi:hypothetical protein
MVEVELYKIAAAGALGAAILGAYKVVNDPSLTGDEMLYRVADKVLFYLGSTAMAAGLIYAAKA